LAHEERFWVTEDRGRSGADVAREAVDFNRTLATRNPDRFQPDLAMSLNNLGSRLSELGQYEAALAATREAVDHYRTLVTRHAEAFQPKLATSLNNLGNRLSELGQHEAALAVRREVADLRRARSLIDEGDED
jgi:tetratricopeptide (TPR) repeat protein